MADKNLDYYVNWSLAKDQLLEVYQEVLSTLQLVDVATTALDTKIIPQRDSVLCNFFRTVTITDEQHLELAQEYKRKINAIKLLVAALNQGEINHGIEDGEEEGIHQLGRTEEPEQSTGEAVG